MVPRVLVTQEAADLIARLKTMHGPLMFHQSGGCCDGSAPMCYPGRRIPRRRAGRAAGRDRRLQILYRRQRSSNIGSTRS